MTGPPPSRRRWRKVAGPPQSRPGWKKRGGILVTLGLPWLFLLEPHSHHRCGTCGSWRDESQYRLGPSRDWSIPLSPIKRGGGTSEVAEKLLGPGHTHRWTFSKGSDGYVFIRWGMICGEGPRARGNPFILEWAGGMSFRKFVDGERAAGRLTQEDVLAIAELPRWPSPEQARDARIVRAFARAQELLKASGVNDTYGSDWSRWSLPEPAPEARPGQPR